MPDYFGAVIAAVIAIVIVVGSFGLTIVVTEVLLDWSDRRREYRDR